MTTLKNLKGTGIQFRDEDPVLYAGTWSSTSSLNSACREGGGSGGPTTAINVGGYPYPMTSEHWNGSTWATFANLGTPRGKNATAGSYTNAIVGNGSTPGTPGIGIVNNVESWNGSSWSEIAEINSIRDSNAMSAGGTNTAVIYFGGNAPGGASVLNESWNGSAWTEVGDLNAARIALTGIGIQTAALAVGGSPDTANTESWNGSAWTEVNNMNTAGDYMGGSSGTQTSALVFGGDPGNTTKTESWDGTSWTEVNNLGTGRDSLKGAGSGSTSALAYGGYTSTDLANSEEWSFPAITASTLNEGDMWFNSTLSTLKGYAAASGIPSTTWASGANLSSVRAQMFSYGASGPTGAVVGGDNSGDVALHEQYNGTAWTEAGDLNTARGNEGRSGSGTQTAALVYGSFSVTNIVESYNGSSWSETTEYSTPRRSAGGAGVQTATIMFGGRNPPAGNYALTEEYNGSAWTEVGDLNSGRYGGSGSGISTSALMISGYTSTYVNLVESYNGTSWSEKSEVNTIHYSAGASSSGSNNTSALVFGGTTGPTIQATTEFWNGSSWTELNDLSTATNNPGGTGSSVSAFSAGGNTPPRVATVEEWTAPAAVVTITTS